MSKTFLQNLKSTIDNTSLTENGMVGYKTTNHALADANFKISAYRSNKDALIKDLKAIIEDKDENILKFLFFIRDVREGLGERETFRISISYLLNQSFEDKDNIIDTIIKETPTFGRFDDLLLFLDTPYEAKVIKLIKDTLAEDFATATSEEKKSKSISLLAKWLPSANASSPKTRKQALKIIKLLGTTEKQYRKVLSLLRSRLDVVEVKTCKKDWDKINYNTVPSQANLKYKNAFLRNDEERRREFLSKLAVGDKKVKINSATNFPHDIIHSYMQKNSSYDETLEQLWKNLKCVSGLKDTLVVRDDSGSMESRIGGTSITALEVATALGIYCAQNCSDAYKNKIITFSESPRYLDFSDSSNYFSLQSKLKYLWGHSEVSNTNIEAVFDLILKTAIDNKLSSSDLPKQILIISDMQFDSCASNSNENVFTQVKARFTSHGYDLPKLVFWNIQGDSSSSNSTIPVIQNDLGVLLVSGFSQNILNLIMNGKTDPYEALIDHLSKERYSKIPLIHFETKEIKEKQIIKEIPDFLK